MAKNYVRAPKDLKLNPNALGKTEMIFSVYDYGHCKSKDGRILLRHSRSIREIPGDGENGEEVFDLSVNINLNTRFWGFEAKDLERISKWAHQAALWIKDREKSGK
jgi:hypothetical protein